MGGNLAVVHVAAFRWTGWQESVEYAAVVDPTASGRYLLGIECDGANYHRTRVARDRDKLRESILRDLGWTLHRIWSADWWTHPAEEVRKLEAALQAARHTPQEPVSLRVNAIASQ